MIRILQSKWVAALVGMIGYVITTVLIWHPPEVESNTPEEADLASKGPSWAFSNPEIDQLITDLRQEKEALEARTTQLNELEARLKAEWQEICQTTQTVGRLQREFDENIIRVKDEEVANSKKLAKIYASMDPDAASSILKELTDEQLVKVLVFMKDGETAPILESMAKKGAAEAKRAAQLSEKLQRSIFRKSAEKTQTP